MKLFRFDYSPFARKVQILLELMGQSHQVIDVPYGDRRELLEVTGGSLQVPVLVSDDGGIFEDSRRICEYLCSLPAGARFVPAPLEGPIWAYADVCDSVFEDVLFRAAAPGLRRRLPTVAERALFTLIKERRYGKGCVESWESDRQAFGVRSQELLRPSARTLSDVPFLFGSSPTLADAALYGQLVMVELGDPSLLRSLDPALLAWKRRLEEASAAGPKYLSAEARAQFLRIDNGRPIARAMSILCVGSVALDSLRTPSGVSEDTLGGSATFFSMAASLFTPVDLVAVVGEDFPKRHLDLLRSRSIGIDGVEIRPGRTFRWKAEYGWDLNEAKTLATELNVFESFKPRVPATLRRPEWLFLGNIDPDLQLSVLGQVERPKLIAADTMNYWIQGKPDSLRQLLSRIDLLFLNDTEARQLAQQSNVVKAALAIQKLGPKIVCVKRGEYGAILFLPAEGGHHPIFAIPAMPLEEVRDPTGAGDSFAGGFLGSLAHGKDLSPAALRRSAVMGTVLASFAVEEFGPEHLALLTPAQIQARFEDFGRLTWSGSA